jgi:hypothetical protein
LGLTLVLDEQAWMQLANQAGAATQKALQEALQVKHGHSKVETVQRVGTFETASLARSKKIQTIDPIAAPTITRRSVAFHKHWI